MGRLNLLKESLPVLVSQPHSSVVLVDYSYPDHSGAWAEDNDPECQIVSVPGETYFSATKARNTAIDIIRDKTEIEWHGTNASEMRLRIYFKGLSYKILPEDHAFHMDHKNSQAFSRHKEDNNISQNKIISEIQNSDILICPSVIASDGDVDTLPNVLKEAMACKLPVIATWHGGIPELVRDYESGFLVREKDMNAIKNKIQLLADSSELRKKMGEKGRRFVQKNYEIEYNNDIILSEYIKLANRYSKSRHKLIQK